MPTNRIQRWLDDQAALTWAKGRTTKYLRQFFAQLPTFEARQEHLGKLIHAANELVCEREDEINEALKENDAARLKIIRDEIIKAINRIKL